MTALATKPANLFAARTINFQLAEEIGHHTGWCEDDILECVQENGENGLFTNLSVIEQVASLEEAAAVYTATLGLPTGWVSAKELAQEGWVYIPELATAFHIS